MARQPSKTLSLVIPTYCREQVLIKTLSLLLKQTKNFQWFRELIVIDQTPKHEPETDQKLTTWHQAGEIKWIRLSKPHLTRAMNDGLFMATGDIVLFTDDDIIPSPQLLEAHLKAHQENPGLTAVVGQVLQPGETPEQLSYQPKGGTLSRYRDFPFRSIQGCFVENVIACNLSLNRKIALSVGGFDEAFLPPVAARFETEFAKRVIKSGGKIWFEPGASIQHLQAQSGGTRSKGSHLTSASPCYGVGDYYYALRQGHGWERVWYILRKPFREIRTKFHLKHPWWIPLKLIGEIRAFYQAWQLFQKPPKLTRPFSSYDEF